MWRRIIDTPDEWAPAIARVALGAVMFPHGAQKALGWYGGNGFDGTMAFFTGTLGIPAVFALLAIAAEFLGSIGLMVGALSRVAALGVASVMAVAITIHKANGFFMNWTGQQKGEGYEYHLLALGLAAIVMLRGGGKWSVDRALSR